MIHLTKSLGFTCNMLLSFTFSSFFFFFKNQYCYYTTEHICGKKSAHPLLGTQPHTEGHGLMRGAQLNVSPKRISWVSTV